MKILYDHQTFQYQRFGGVSRYFSEIIRHLPKDISYEVSIQYTFNEYLKALNLPVEWKDQLLPYANFLKGKEFLGKKRLFSYINKAFPKKYPNYCSINQEGTIKKLKGQAFDIFHPTFFDDYYLNFLGKKPYVLTVHDMIITLYPEFINSPAFVKRKKKLIDNAAHIIAVSENTKQDIMNVFGTAFDKISVVYHGSSLKEVQGDTLDLPENYLLYVGDRRLGYKNFSFMVSSLQPILQNNPDLYLLCTGDFFTEDEQSFFKALGIEDQIKVQFVQDNQMYELYNKARMFIYPSYYEGFGIPILEAFQAKCPVILSRSSCFPEVAADGAVYFAPKSPQELRRMVNKLLIDTNFRNDIIVKGTERLRKFSWKKSALETVEIYKQILA